MDIIGKRTNNDKEISNESSKYIDSPVKNSLKQKIMQTKSRNDYIKAQMENQRYYNNNKFKQASNVGEILEDEFEEVPKSQNNNNEKYPSELPPLVHATNYVSNENTNNINNMIVSSTMPIDKNRLYNREIYATSSTKTLPAKVIGKNSEETLLESDQDDNQHINSKSSIQSKAKSIPSSQNTVHEEINQGSSYYSFNSSMEVHKDENEDELSIHPSDISFLSNTTQDEEKYENNKVNKEVLSNINEVENENLQKEELDLTEQQQQKPPPSPVKKSKMINNQNNKTETKENRLSLLRQFFSQSVTSSHNKKQNKNNNKREDKNDKENDIPIDDIKKNNNENAKILKSKNEQNELKEIIMSLDENPDEGSKKENLSRIFNEMLQNSKDQDLEALINITDFNQLNTPNEDENKKIPINEENLNDSLVFQSDLKDVEMPQENNKKMNEEKMRSLSPNKNEIENNKNYLLEESTVISYTMSGEEEEEEEEEEEQEEINETNLNKNYISSPSKKSTSSSTRNINRPTNSTMDILYNSENQSIIEDVDKILSKNFNKKSLSMIDKNLPKNFIKTESYKRQSFYNNPINNTDPTQSYMSSPRSYTDSEEIIMEEDISNNKNNVIGNYKEFNKNEEEKENLNEYFKYNDNNEIKNNIKQNTTSPAKSPIKNVCKMISNHQEIVNNITSPRKYGNTSRTAQSLPVLISKTNDVVTNTILSQDVLSRNRHIDLLPSESTFIPVTQPKSLEEESEISEVGTIKQNQNTPSEEHVENENPTTITSITNTSTKNYKNDTVQSMNDNDDEISSNGDNKSISTNDDDDNDNTNSNKITKNSNEITENNDNINNSNDNNNQDNNDDTNITTELSSPVNFTESVMINNDEDNSVYYEMDNSQLIHLQKNLNGEKGERTRTKYEHEIIQMAEKDKNKNDNAEQKRDNQEENSILLSDDEKSEDESVEVTETRQKELNESLKHSAISPQVLYNTTTSCLSELDEKQKQFILSNSQKITESLNIGSPNSKLELLSNSTKNHNQKLKDLLLRSSPISKQQIQRQIVEGLIGIRSEEEKIYQLTQELVQARDIINQLRDSLTYSDDEKVQLQKEFDCFQDKVEIERLNWKNEFKKIKEIQAQDYKEKVQLSNYIKEMEENMRTFHENELKNKKVYQETAFQLKESQEGYNQLESDFNLLSKKYKELEQYLMKLKQSNENIIQENKLLKDANQELMQINDDLKKGNKQLIQMNKSLEEENRKIEASKESFYKEESENMASKMQEVMQKNHEYISQLNKMKSVQDVIENEYNEIKSLLNEERNKNDQCESELTVFGRRIRTLLEQNNKLNKENDRIRTELRNLQFNPPLGKSDTQNDNRISFNSDVVNDFPSSSKIRNNLVSYSTYSVPKNLRNSSSATDLKNVKWATNSNSSNDNMEDTYRTNIRSSFKNSNIPIYTNNNKNQSIPSSSNTNFGWDNNSYSPTPSSSSYSNSPKKYLKNRSSFDMQLNNITSKIPINTSNNMNNNHNTYMNTITKMSPKELENLLRSLTLRKDQLQSEYVKVPSSNKRRKEILEEKLDEVEKQMGGCRMRLKALKVM